MRTTLAVIAATLFFVSTPSNAEIFFRIGYRLSLGGVKTIFPNATYTKLNPAWLGNDQALFRIHGDGMTELIVGFSDSRPGFKSFLPYVSDEKTAEVTKRLANESDDDALNVIAVRVIYRSPVPISEFNKKYGAPSRCYTNDDFSYKCEWSSRSMIANFSSDKNFITMAESDFTNAEKRLFFTSNGIEIPANLKAD